jgi:glycosyltransferase involved in cell wall biosynthesis
MRPAIPRLRRTDPDRPIRVAQVCGLTDGGLWMVQLCAGLRRRGYEVVAIIASENGATAAALREAGVPFVAVPHRLTSHGRLARGVARVPILYRLVYAVHALALLRSAARMARVLRRHRVDVVHTHVFSSMIVGRLAGWMARVPLRVAMIPGPYHLEAPLLRWLDLRTRRLDHLLIAGCERTNELYAELGVPAAVTRTVGYGVDPTRFDPDQVDGASFRRELGVAGATPLIGQVAFFYAVIGGPAAPPWADGRGIKGHEDLLHAARLVLKRRPDARFVLVGDGWGVAGTRHLEDMRELARTLGIDHAVTFTGRRGDVPEVLAALDVSVQCSLSDNYGGTIESLMMRRPTVATRAGGLPETVRDGETGLLVPMRDPAALAAAILRLVEDPALGRRLGAAGRDLMLERHTIQHTIAGVAAVYAEASAERGLSHRRPASPDDGALSAGGLGLDPRDVLFGADA